MTKPRIWIVASTAALAFAGIAVPVAGASHAAAQSKQRDDQGEARREMRAGNQLLLREIERRVLPQMKDAEYLGQTYDAAAHAYRLKFIKDGHVFYVDVDARTGRIINRSR